MGIACNAAEVSSRPVGKAVIGEVALERIAAGEFVAGVEIVIDLDVDLFAVVKITCFPEWSELRRYRPCRAPSVPMRYSGRPASVHHLRAGQSNRRAAYS
jgi:hypothetical protein